ncbi:MAG: S8/S53 family peptidase [Bacteroidales bacterium]
MKNTSLLLVLMMFISTLFAQESKQGIYELQFKDKGSNTDAAVNPSAFLSEKAIERRLKHQIQFDQSDIPVNENYINTLTENGVKILTRSRWFNNVVVEATPDMVEQISALPFVVTVKLLDDGTNRVSQSQKPFLEAETTNNWTAGITKKATSDLYDYGAAFNQINQLHGQYLHNHGYSGLGMTIAVLDAGFNSVDVMTCFDSLRANNQIKGTRDFAQPGNNVYATTMHTHGTSVLSCMGAYANGLMVGTAPKANYWLLRSEVGEYENIIEEYFWVSAAEFADSIGADLINSSLGYTVFDPPGLNNHTYADMDGNTTYITKGADKAAEKGILVVNSAGNSGGTFDPWKYIGAPADGDSVFSIGSVDADGNRSSFSSLGPTYDRRIKPTVSAQGTNSAIFSPGGLSSGSGTSFSSPITCGITACLWQALPSLNNMEIIEAIKATSSQVNHPDSLLGWGIPNYELAITTLSVHNQAVDKILLTYPNPVADKLTIGLPDILHGNYTVQIIDIQGKIVYSTKGYNDLLRSFQINNLSNLASGIYLIKLTDDLMTYSGKFVKK